VNTNAFSVGEVNGGNDGKPTNFAVIWDGEGNGGVILSLKCAFTAEMHLFWNCIVLIAFGLI